MRIATYQEFWPFYLQQHSQLWTRRVHVVGLLAGMAVFAVGLMTRSYALWLLALPTTYAVIWPSHFWIEKNKPATFQYPIWSLYSECRMVFLILRGKIPF